MAAPSIYVPSPNAWAPAEIVTAPQLRSVVSGAVQFLSRPPMFIGSQTTTAQNLPTSNADTPVILDTETYDNLDGHRLTENQAVYYGMFPGWYLAEGSVPLNYVTGASGTFLTAGIQASQDGFATTVLGMTIPCQSGFFPAVSVARLVQMVDTGAYGGASNDFISLIANQITSGAAALLNSASRYPSLSALWVSALSGAQPLPVPVNAAFPPPSTTLTAPVSAGGTTLHVASATGMTFYGGLGGTLGLDTGSSNAETVTLTAPPSGLTVPVTATQFAHASASTVTVPLSAAFMNQNVRDTVAFLTYPPIMQWAYFGTSATLASQSSVPAVGIPVQLQSPTVDNYGAYSESASAWTAPVAGTYYAYGQVAITKGLLGTGTQAYAAGLTVTSPNYNGGTTATLWGGALAANSSVPGSWCAIVRRSRLRLNAGDTVALAGFQRDIGGSAATLLGPFSGELSCRMIICWRGS